MTISANSNAGNWLKLHSEFERNLNLYGAPRGTSIAVTGSVAWHFRTILKEVFSKNGFVISSVCQGPIEGLIKYHRENS